jgi:hypothetical protein
MFTTRFAAGRAMFISWMFSNRALGGQWAQRAARRAGGYGRPGATPEITGRGRVWNDRTVDWLQPGSKGAGTINRT